MNEETRWIAIKGAIGVVSPFIGAGVSVLTEVEAWLRIGSLLVGMSVGVATLYSIWVKRDRQQKRKKK